MPVFTPGMTGDAGVGLKTHLDDVEFWERMMVILGVGPLYATVKRV